MGNIRQRIEIRRKYAPRCKTPDDPRWRKVVDPPEVPDLDLRDFGVPEALASLKEDES